MKYIAHIRLLLKGLPKKFIFIQILISLSLLFLESFYFLYYSFLNKYYVEIINILNIKFDFEYDNLFYIKIFILFFIFIILPIKYIIFKKLAFMQIRLLYQAKNKFVVKYYNILVNNFRYIEESFKDLIFNKLEIRFQQGIKPIFTLVQEAGISLIIITILILSYPFEIVCVLTLFILYKLFLNNNNKIIYKISNKRLVSNKRLINLYDYIDNDRLFIMISGYRYFLQRRLVRIYSAYSNSIIRFNFIQANVRNSQESMFYLILCLFVLTFLVSSSSPDNLYLMSTTVFLGGLRLLPSVNRISGALNDISFSSQFTLHELEEIHAKRTCKFITDMKFEHFGITYHLQHGDILLITGDSGSGKSTFLKNLILNPSVLFINSDHKSNIYINSDELFFSYVDQRCILYAGQFTDNINMPVDNINVFSFTEALLEFGISVDKIANLDELSGGQKQVFCVLRAIFSDKTIVILDEPTSSLDYESEVLLCSYIKAHSVNKIIIIVTHREYPLNLSNLRLII
jgi:ABC-type lipoprotein export system ATPase subunit